MNDLVDDNLRITGMYNVCKAQNDTKANWIQKMYKDVLQTFAK